MPAQAALCAGGLAAIAARSGQPDLAHALWAAVEHWERERGVLLADYERARYEEAISCVTPASPLAPLTRGGDRARRAIRNTRRPVGARQLRRTGVRVGEPADRAVRRRTG